MVDSVSQREHPADHAADSSTCMSVSMRPCGDNQADHAVAEVEHLDIVGSEQPCR